MSELLEAAKRYLAYGLHPIPCEPRGKRPLLESWKPYQEQAPTVEKLEAWWERWPDANIGLVLGRGMFAVDVDSEEGARGLVEAGVVLPPYAPRSTTGKGYHVFLAGDSPDKVGLVSGVDIRGVGYVIAPPSVHPTGKSYSWVYPYTPDALPAAPLRLLELIQTARVEVDRDVSPTWLSSALAGVGDGQRDVTCTRIAGYFLAKGVEPAAVFELLLGWAERCTPPFPAHEVAKCVESIAKREGEHEIDLEEGVLTVEALYASAPEEHQWIWQDYLPEGSLAMLVAEEKAGKSTLFYALAAAVSKGWNFIGRETQQAPVLVLAVEEDATDVKLRARTFGMRPSDPVYFRVGDLPNTPRTHEQIRDVVLKHGIKLVFLDTLGHHLATVLESENDNLAVLKAVRPWMHLARETRACVVLVHHTGKSGQKYRGASAFGGVVDQILTLQYTHGNQRQLMAHGRYKQSPACMLLALEPTTNNYYEVK